MSATSDGSRRPKVTVQGRPALHNTTKMNRPGERPHTGACRRTLRP
jgi:hypothetical protein